MLKTTYGVIALVGMLMAAAPAPAQTAAQAPAQAPAKTMFRPIAIVNDSAITGFDLWQRAQILVALGYAATDQNAVRSRALDDLIDDRLKLQEAKRMGLTVTNGEIEDGLKAYADRAKVSLNEFKAVMNAQGITNQALNDMAAADVLWAKVVRSRFIGRVDPGEAEIDSEIALMQAHTNASYHVMEIGIPGASAGRNEAQTKALADKLYASLSQGGDFAAAVKAYSGAPSAKNGGDAGWISTAQMQPALLDALAGLEPGEVSLPIPVAGGFWIMKLVETRTDKASALDPNDPKLRESVRQRLITRRGARLAEGLLQELRRDAVIAMR